MSRSWKSFLFLLALITVTIWLAVFLYPDQNFRLIACDVGQGDAILATYGRTQILVDGGPDRKVLDCLSEYLPFWDREVEVVVNTHPQKDHFGGLIDVLKTYDVGVFIATPLDSSSQEWQVLKELVGSKGVGVMNPTNGQKLRVGMIYLDILWPTQGFLSTNLGKNSNSNTKSATRTQQTAEVLGTATSKKDPNEFSVVVVLSFDEFDALLTGDIGPEIENEVISTGRIRDVDYIKIPHHGSKNGLTKEFLEMAKPQLAVISVGKDNSYGHPHEEILKILRDKDVKILRTDEVGDVLVESDGKEVWIAK